MAKSKSKKDVVSGSIEEQKKVPEVPCSLEFPCFGWCHELTPPFRYSKGHYTPKNAEEYSALKKYAK